MRRRNRSRCLAGPSVVEEAGGRSVASLGMENPLIEDVGSDDLDEEPSLRRSEAQDFLTGGVVVEIVVDGIGVTVDGKPF